MDRVAAGTANVLQAAKTAARLQAAVRDDKAA